MSTSTTEPSSTESSRAETSRDLVCGLAMLAVVAVFLGTAGDVGEGNFDWLFPVVLSYGLGALAVVLVVRGLLGQGERMSVVPAVLRGQGFDVATFSLLSVLYVALVPPVGFWVMSALTMFVAAVYLDTRRSARGIRVSLVVAILVCAFSYLVLTQIFFITFPPAPWW